ncbi:hypothetical protein CEE37_13060 [candidate division LCP-89 bacterium B3_LCP]|uniref:Helix-turn-helix domain-containing protein n=1 Tax=candidate division LCP-89 bacterium B3_LCP TaxID=2012998 RepID=A0A532UU47_UNCL8|nr:MAG: hypothetical protein CEE37_13060 [candidate division LCP-89 bacterium B3_LCP]
MSEFLTTGKAAALCSVTPDTVLKWVKAGKIPAKRTAGGHCRIRRGDLFALLKQMDDQQLSVIEDDRQFKFCWEFYSETEEIQAECSQCIVYRSRAHRCYEMSQLPYENGHAKLHCQESCENCGYYHLVRWQNQNILVITEQHSLQTELEDGTSLKQYNLCFTDSEYKCSMLMEDYRPDYIILDCSIGSGRVWHFVRNIAADPRIPFVKIVLVGEGYEFPQDCEKEIFAQVESPLTRVTLMKLLGASNQNSYD